MTQLILDECMKFFYNSIVGIDPDELTLLENPLSELEIRVGRGQSLTDFLKGRIRVVTLDSFSTREQNEASIKEAGMPEEAAKFYEPFYVEYTRQYGVVELGRRKIGIADTVQMYNGFPGIIDMEEFLQTQDKGQAYVDAIRRCHEAGGFPTQNCVCGRTHVALHRDFLRKHPVSKKVIDPRRN